MSEAGNTVYITGMGAAVCLKDTQEEAANAN
jgi:hypothetical protein